ncbi:TniQ protein [Methylobacterium phyllostachyos]|uniref:TniQ protein n=1 Tax=Methylobacterium phyllostachyos TaxID=582672 RepID=A0A1H0HT65_9HYPH|nr:TniQ family protein [Methylobacterium phyllostachyos]SDO22392.1 TniQ protein [Methylobacterium phyllostachyos]
MPHLLPFLALGDGESPTSFASRLSVLHDVNPVRTFLSYLGLSFPALAAGDPHTIDALAKLADVSAEALREQAIRRTNETFVYRNQTMVRATMRRSRYYACPHCLAADIAASSVKPEIAAYGRALWQFSPIRTCPVHGVYLVQVGQATRPGELHDFARGVGQALTRLNPLVAGAVPAIPSSTETYLLGRLNCETSRSTWLDGMPWHAAAKTCEMLGAVSIFGPTPRLRSLTDPNWHRAGSWGFEIAQSGDQGIRAFLTDIQRSHARDPSAQDEAQAVFSRLYQWLDAQPTDSAFQPLIDVVADHITDTMPVGPGDVILGRSVQRRKLHSIRSASVALGRNPKRLRKILAQHRIIDAAQSHRADNLVLFDAVHVDAILKDDRAAFSLKAAETYLNAGRVHTKIIADHGFIRPLSNGVVGKAVQARYARSELDRFLDELDGDAVTVMERGKPIFDIPQAAKRARCGAHEIIHLIRDRRLNFVGRDPTIRGYLGILVDLDEIETHVHGKPLDGLTARAIEKRLRTTTAIVVKLLDKGYIPSRSVTNPINRCPVRVVSLTDMAAFETKYVLLSELARVFETNALQMGIRLDRAGAKPAISKDEAGIDIYLRDGPQ